MEIWKWAKAHGIDKGLPFSEIHDLIAKEYFSGGKDPKTSQWINEILKGRKTPLRQVSTEAWRAQANRRIAIEKAKQAAGRAAMSPAGRALSAVLEAPRAVAVGVHAYAFPFTHSGEMIFQPRRWKLFYETLKNTYGPAHSKAETEQILNGMYKDVKFNQAINDGVDLSPKVHGGELVNLGGMSERAWDMIKVLRFGAYKQDMLRWEAKNPKASPEERAEMGKYLATMANHATGSGQGFLTSSKAAGNILFGAKLTQSKLNRIAEAGKTLATYANWKNASPVQRAAANAHFTQMATFALTYGGFLTANQGLLWATGAKDKDGKPTQINWKDPTKSDWMKFKGVGLELGVPGIRSELQTIGKILAVTFNNSKETNPKHESLTKRIGNVLLDYGSGKLSPTSSLAKEIVTGEAFPHRPVPWNAPWYNPPPKPGPVTQPFGIPGRFAGLPIQVPPGLKGWDEYLLSHGPIPLTGPIRFFYDQARERGMSAMDATSWIKALIIGGIGFTGLHIGEDFSQTTETTALRNFRACCRHKPGTAFTCCSPSVEVGTRRPRRPSLRCPRSGPRPRL